MKIPDIYREGHYLSKNPTWHSEDSAWKSNQIFEIIEKNQINVESIAEIGCGAGDILKELSIKYPEKSFAGYEISPQAFTLSKGKESLNLKFNLEDLLREDNERIFDLLLVVDVIEHVDDYYGFLEMCKNKAVFCIFHIPLDLSAQSIIRIQSLLSTRNRVGHIHYFTQELAFKALEYKGFKVIDYKFTNRAIDKPNSFRTRLLNVPRRLIGTFSPSFSSRLFGGYSLLVLAK